jgi:uncharacterized membrane protein
MIPDPLHPAIVHFPIVLAVLLPLTAVGALWAIRRGTAPRRAWTFPLAVAGALALSAFVAVKSGQAQQERVERVVGDRPLESHEGAAELFLVLSGVLLVIAGVGLAPGAAGRAARIVAALGAVGLLGAGYRVGASGGDLVYRHGAASAYTSQTGPAGSVAEPESGEGEGGQ